MTGTYFFSITEIVNHVGSASLEETSSGESSSDSLAGGGGGVGGGGACSSSLTRNSSPGSTSGSSMGAIPKQYVNTYSVNPPAACPKSPAAPDSLMGRLSPMVTGNHHPSRLHRLQMLQAKKQPKGGLRYTGAAAAADTGGVGAPTELLQPSNGHL